MPGQFLPGSQSSARVANAELESKPLRAGTQQIHSPGIGVTMFDCFKQIAVRRRSIDAGEHRLAALEDLVMQTHLNGRQIDAAVDDDRLLGGGRLHVVYSAFADVHAHNWLRVSVGTKSPVRSMAIDKQQLRSWMPA